MSKRKVSVALLVAAAFLAGVFFVTSVFNLAGWSGLFQGADAQAVLPESEAIAVASDLGVAFSTVAEHVNPAVVQVRTTRTMADNGQGLSLPDMFGGSPFGRGGPRGGEQSGIGSGAFVSADGYIVTNNHVVEGADLLEVLLFDGRVLDAEVVGTDPFSDLAVLRVEGSDYPYVPFGDSDELRVGQWVLAFGSPLSEELSNTVTSGIVSSLGRFGGAPDPRGRQTISNYIQTDAAVNPGNSGGPLVNLRGEIVGINSAIATRTGTFNGISFAIPSDIVRSTVEQLIDTGTVERGYLGISFQAATPALREAYDLGPGAARVGDISPDATGRTPAADAGIRPDDIITAVDGVELRDSAQIVSLISNKRPGDTVEVTYYRDGKRREAEITLGRRPGDDAVSQNGRGRSEQRPMSGSREPASLEAYGLTLRDLTPQQARQLGGDAAGVLVADVERASYAYREAEIRQGQLIVEANREPVASVADFRQAVADVEPGGSFLVRVRVADGRGNSAEYLTALTKEG
ncbi:trypsin-like peptidase domain-containing protein [Rubrivirga litoralis]|uniref:Trypsin-like peptidase domain-containing protein n=1 Tax=Rubrivirga litoralis TaxID=3075598 RepID=A0ABU3BSM2_9BACT|nr:trypsin-like peptidase domain-containing protein [Rubrivirga sp. F394]MDT0632292.1 trypsin-like peptidase domain-containing protein [Rubrivirga sp. F394]